MLTVVYLHSITILAILCRCWFWAFLGTRDLLQPRNCQFRLLDASPRSCWHCCSDLAHRCPSWSLQGNFGVLIIAMQFFYCIRMDNYETIRGQQLISQILFLAHFLRRTLCCLEDRLCLRTLESVCSVTLSVLQTRVSSAARFSREARCRLPLWRSMLSATRSSVTLSGSEAVCSPLPYVSCC